MIYCINNSIFVIIDVSYFRRSEQRASDDLLTAKTN